MNTRRNVTKKCHSSQSKVVTINSTTSTKIADINRTRSFLCVSINGDSNNIGIFIKLQAASIDNEKKGIWIGKNLDEDGSYSKISWEMPQMNIYTGEISAICQSGSHELNIIEY